MGDSPKSEKKPIENGISNDSEDSGNTSEQEPCLPTNLSEKKEMDMTDTLDSKHLDTEMMKQNKRRAKINTKPRVSVWVTIKSSFVTAMKYLSEKTGLSNVGLAVAAIILILFLICLISLLIMGILWPTVPHELRFPICRRSACLRSSSHILPRMNFNVSPCDDFRQYACGGWLQTHPHPPPDHSDWSLRRQLEHNIRDRLRQLIVTQPHPTSASTFAWKTKYFYESCMALDNIETAKDVMLSTQINSLGGWNVLREFQVHSFDLRDTFTRLQADFGVPLFFKVDVVPDPYSEQDFIIQILPSDLGMPHKSYYYRSFNSKPLETYKRYLKDVAQLLGATSSDAATFSEDMFFFERRLAEVTPDSQDLRPFQAALRMNVSELKNVAPSVPFYDVLLRKFPEANIDDHTQILVPFPDYLRNISNLISTTDRTALNNYMMWRLTDSFLPYLSEKFRNTVAGYRRELFGEHQQLPRWEMCIKTMQKFMGFGLAVLLQNHAEDFQKDTLVVEEIFRDVMREVKRSVRNAGWLPQELQEHMNSKLMSMVVEVGLPTGGTFLSDTNLEEVYRQLFVINRDFFQNVKYGIAYLQKQQQLRLSKFDGIYRWVDAASSHDLKVRYVAAANKVVVPQALLREPYFHPDYPLAVLFGGLGVEISSAVVEAITPWNVLYADDGTLIDRMHPAVDQSGRSFFHPTSCLRQWWGKEGFASSQASEMATYNALIKLSGVNIALKTMQAHLAHLPHTHQPALESYDDGHLFFITFAQSVCSVTSPEQKDLDETVDNILDDKSMLSVVLSQVKDFAKLFSCTAANVLYSEIPCEDVI
ncbi:endothelin-converting enzyme 2-like [Macrosteles quadrilineatus]|uniref:endothelin-converting enzyme 2-like n=1 Tax=Macrosteles quadrilineatus TaxID=74068 RepID=UPI0023E16556|nr:endothelin-converting enzyme 2-like [Macrosteles quadrilineatus]